jgi:hypothetical protein
MKIDDEQKPLAFISTSLLEEDRRFVELIEKLSKENGFEPMGTVGRYSASPISLWDHMIEKIQESDCVIMAATPRYIQTDVHHTNIIKLAPHFAPFYAGPLSIVYKMTLRA